MEQTIRHFDQGKIFFSI